MKSACCVFMGLKCEHKLAEYEHLRENILSNDFQFPIAPRSLIGLISV